MILYSTKHKSPNVNLKEAVIKGLPNDNGLYMPINIERLPDTFFKEIDQLPFEELSLRVAQHLIGDFVPSKDLKEIVFDAINFEAPVHFIDDNLGFLELFHGPTLAFKDFGARFMARIMGYFLKNENREVNILVATSGDTGSAVAHGFLDVEGIKVTVLYPKGKVSEIQERQFTTLGRNITALEIEGTFDDCQHLVKTAFLDEELNKKMNLSSANSINIARLIPQSFYYFNAYKQLDNKDLPLYFCVPSGNFGNLTAGLFAQKMGLPITKMIAANNSNDEFKIYVDTGVFEPKPSISTISNAMDVGNPSNFWRILDMCAQKHDRVIEKIAAYSFSDEETKEGVKEIFKNHNYIMCPHTAVGYLGMKSFVKEKALSKANKIVLSTAHPVKFKEVVEPIINGEVAIPERLKKVLGNEKKSISMTNSYNDFKAFLIEENA